MGAARWVVVGTAIIAAAIAFHLLLSPEADRRPVSWTERADASSAGSERPEPRSLRDDSDGFEGAGASRGRPGPPSAPPQEELDAASRDAMRSFLRRSVQESGPESERDRE